MRAADTSLVIAAFASWHQTHEPARTALDAGLRLIEHCALESHSVLTNDAELVTCDRRAIPVYERYGVRTIVL